MTIQIALLLFIICASVVLFSFEQLPADAIALGIMLTLILTGLIPAKDAFAGYGSETVMMILGLLILTAALTKTGVVDLVGKMLLRRTRENPDRLLIVIMVSTAILSAFISNTAATAFFVPITLVLARQLKVNPSKLLMPLSISAILASSVTMISTSTNIVVSGMMTSYQMEPMGMFELTLVGIPVLIIGLAYMYFIGRRLIHDRGIPEDFFEKINTYSYISEVIILPGSSLIGKTLAESQLGKEMDLTVLKIIIHNHKHLEPRADLKIEEGDTLLVEAQRDNILNIKDTIGIEIKGSTKLSNSEQESEDFQFIEVILLPGSPLIGKTLVKARFRERYRLQVLGINRNGKILLRKISRIRLKVGDQLLIQGNPTNINMVSDDNTFRVLGIVSNQQLNTKKAPLAIMIFFGVLILSALEFFSLPVAVLLGAFLTFITGCITPEEAYRNIEWKALILIGAMLALGNSIIYTGTDVFIADQFLKMSAHANPIFLLSIFFGLTMLLTQPMSNQAAAVVVIPIAIETALIYGLNPRTFAMMIAVGASCSYLTPLEPSCLIVYGPGNYRFSDFLKVGSILTVLVYLIAIFLVPLIWPL